MRLARIWSTLVGPFIIPPLLWFVPFGWKGERLINTKVGQSATGYILYFYLLRELVKCKFMIKYLTLKVLVATIDALGHFETA